MVAWLARLVEKAGDRGRTGLLAHVSKSGDEKPVDGYVGEFHGIKMKSGSFWSFSSPSLSTGNMTSGGERLMKQNHTLNLRILMP
jgi:hypothetical protein